MTLDDGKQRLMNGQKHRVVDGRGQVVEGHRLQRPEDEEDMMRVGEEPLALTQQWCHGRHRGNRERNGQRDVLRGGFYQKL